MHVTVAVVQFGATLDLMPGMVWWYRGCSGPQGCVGGVSWLCNWGVVS